MNPKQLVAIGKSNFEAWRKGDSDPRARGKALRVNIAIVGAITCLSVLVAGCGSGGSTSASSSSSGSGSTSTSADTNGGVAQATQIVEQAEAPVTQFSGPTDTPKPPPDKKVLFVNPIAAAYGGQTQENSVETAVKALAPAGWSFTSIDGKGNPTLYNSAILKGIALHVNGIVLGSIDQRLVTSSIEEAKKAGIKVVSQWSGNIGPSAEYVHNPGAKGGPGTVEMEVPQPDIEEGRIKAAYTVAQTEGKAHVFVLATPEYPNESAKVKSFEASLKELCPTECSIAEEQDVNEAQATTQVPQVVKAALQSNPEINFVYAPYDDVALLADQGVREAGRTGDVEIVSSVGVPPALEAVCGGNSSITATIVEAPIWPGFAATDALIRLFDGQNPATPELFEKYQTPIRLITKENCPSGNESPIGYDIPAAWEKVWGVG